MFGPSFFTSPLYSQILIPILIFLARIIDVSMGTLRIIFISRGMRILAAFFGFIEILIWLMAISQIIQNLDNWVNFFAYALGFGMGNYVGISIERKLSMGSLMIRLITRRDASELVNFLGSQGYGVTSVDAQGVTGPVKVIFTIVRRKYVDKIIEIVKRFDPHSFYTIEEIRFVTERKTRPLNSSSKKFFQRFNDFFQKRK